MEHLGCTMWADNANGEYVPTGGYEWGTTYTTQKQGTVNLRQPGTAGLPRRGPGHEPFRRHRHPVVTVLPAPTSVRRRGRAALRWRTGTVSLCPLPSYLLQAGSRTQPELLNLDKLDKHLIYGQIQSFARTISALDAAPATDF